jgi:hypothetical protein
MAGFLEHIAHRTRCFSIDSYHYIVLPVMLPKSQLEHQG